MHPLSASIATLIRLKFLSDLTDTSDILCKKLPRLILLPSLPARTLLADELPVAGTDAMVWTLVEPGVAIVASSLVTIRPLLRKMRLKGFESTERSRGLQYTGQSGSLGATGGSRGGATTRSGQRRAGGMPGYGRGSSIKLTDLEPGFGGGTTGGGKGGGGYWSQATTLTSRTSTHAGRNGWGVGVAVTVREDDEDTDRISPVVAGGGHGHGRSGVSTPESDVFVIEGPARTQQPGQAAGAWRSETPTSAEESEHSQGLRYPGHHGGESTAAVPASHPRNHVSWPLAC